MFNSFPAPRETLAIRDSSGPHDSGLSPASRVFGMTRYRMDVFKPGRKPGHPTPLLWRRYDIYASDDATAQAKAEDLYRTHSSERTLTSFYLYDSVGRSIYESVKRDTPNVVY
jgi:hypothetical protein